MAEALAAIGLAGSIVQFVDLTAKVIARLEEFKVAYDRVKTLDTVTIQLPFLRLLADRIRLDCEQRRADHVEVDQKRDDQLLSVIQGLERQVTALQEIMDQWSPRKNSMAHKVHSAVTSFAKDKEIAAIEQKIETYKTMLILHYNVPGAHRTSPGLAPPSYEASIVDAATAKTIEEVSNQKVVEEQGGVSAYNVLPRHVSHFVGRAKPLKQIRQLHENCQTQRCVVVLQGMGGTGKTQTALQYATNQFSDDWPDARVLWVDSMSPGSVLRSFENIYAMLLPHENPSADQKLKRQMVLQEIARWQVPWLIIFDNYDKPNLFGNITENFPRVNRGAILFTTRNVASAERLGHCIFLKGLDPDECVDLFFRRSGHSREADNLVEASEIVKRLGYLPLAVDQAAAYMKARHMPLHDFWSHYDNRAAKILSHIPSDDFEYKRVLEEGGVERTLSVFTTWELSLEESGNEGQDPEHIVSFLTTIAFFDSCTISEMLFQFLTEQAVETGSIKGSQEWLQLFLEDDDWDAYTFQDVVAQCYQLSLIQSFDIQEASTSFTIHPLIADWLRLRQPPEKRRATFFDIARTLQNLIDSRAEPDRPMVNWNDFDLKSAQEILSYIDDCLRHENTFKDKKNSQHLDAATLKSFALVEWALDRFGNAEHLYEKAWEYQKSAKKTTDEMALSIQQSLGEVYSNLDKFDKSMAAFEFVLDARQSSCSFTDPKLLDAKFNCAMIHRRRGDLGEALPTMRECVRIAEAESIDPRRSIDWYGNLGLILSKSSCLEEAEKVLRATLATCKRVKMHMSLEYIWPLNWLIRLLCLLERTNEARAMILEEHPLFLDRFGADSWEVCFATEIEGYVLWRSGELQAAKKKLRNCYETFFKMYNQRFDVEEVLEINYFLGEINCAQGNADGAMEQIGESVDGWERMCGIGTFHALEALGALLELQLKAADEMAIRNTVDRLEVALYKRKVFDKEAPAVLSVFVNLSHAYGYLGEKEAAGKYLEDAVIGFEKVFGSKHSRTIAAVDELAAARVAALNIWKQG